MRINVKYILKISLKNNRFPKTKIVTMCFGDYNIYRIMYENCMGGEKQKASDTEHEVV